ncbi:MAG: hypothetical protein JST30_14525 [Armatimonadetes bacterium]|nr:hypothetical protein [Armatimonadota bacterium]
MIERSFLEVFEEANKRLLSGRISESSMLSEIEQTAARDAASSDVLMVGIALAWRSGNLPLAGDLHKRLLGRASLPRPWWTESPDFKLASGVLEESIGGGLEDRLQSRMEDIFGHSKYGGLIVDFLRASSLLESDG